MGIVLHSKIQISKGIMPMKLPIFLLLSAFLPNVLLAQISFITPNSTSEHAIILDNAIRDADSLLLIPSARKGAVKLRFVLKDADTTALGSTITTEKGIRMVHYPEHGYHWTGTFPEYTCTALSYQGLAFGLYGLMDHVLGIRFLHPRQTLFPEKLNWPETLDHKAQPRFNKKGFHLHTQHPLELTEQLHNPDLPHAWEDVKEYIDWLARNRQNYWEFCLLRTLDMKRWQPHAKRMVDYSHERGLMVGVDLSLHMIQQRTYQLYKNFPKSWRGKENQLKRNLAQVMYADWDFLNVEFSTAEFVGGKEKLKTRLKHVLIAEARNRYGTNIMGRKHVVNEENMVGKQSDVFSASDSIDLYRGVGIHTVMIYSLTDSIAPVYENKDFSHIYRDMLKENKVREVWFYPESAYWVTYDLSVPMLMMPYLSGRLSDILLCEKEGIPNHLTFSSGWEWGYWTVDFSIAHWSWKETVNGKEVVPQPLDWATTIGLDDPTVRSLNGQLELQKEALISQNLLQFLCPQTITDEFSLFRKQFQPRPDYTFKWLRNGGSDSVIQHIEQVQLPQMRKFISNSIALNAKLKTADPDNDLQADRMLEYSLGISVTIQRARHRLITLQAMIAYAKKNDLLGDSLISIASTIRIATIPMVRQQEALYRYDKEWLYKRRYSFTSYQYGYLFPVHDLHFWLREEEQIKRNRFSAFYRSIWDLGKIVGI